MIEFITLRSFCVPLMEEGPYAQNFMLNKFDFSVSITFTSFAFLFLKGNYFKGTNLTSWVQGLITTANIYMYTHVYFVHIRIYAKIQSINSSGSPSVSSRPLGSHPSTSHYMCACVYTHSLHPHALRLLSKLEKIQTRISIFLMSKITPHASKKWTKG